jgi:hypothetical protein
MFRFVVHPVRAFGATALTLLILVAVVAPAASADTRGCQIVHNTFRCIAVHKPLVPKPSQVRMPLIVSCSWQGQPFPCHDPEMGWFDNQDGCYYRPAIPQPAFDPNLWQGHQNGQGAIYAESCVAINHFRFVWQSSLPVGPATKSSVQLAQQAFATLTLPRPVPPTSPSGATLPDGRPYTVVQVPTWYWTTPSSYRPKTARAAVGPVWAQVTATPVALTFTPGDTGSTVSCAGPGRVWTAQVGPWTHAPGGCDYSYPQSTYGYPGGQLTATYGIVWRAIWTGSGGSGGAFPDVSTTARSRFAVAEAQAVIVR